MITYESRFYNGKHLFYHNYTTKTIVGRIVQCKSISRLIYKISVNLPSRND